MPALLPGGWPDMAGSGQPAVGRIKFSTGKEWLESIFRHHEVVCDLERISNVGKIAFRGILHAFLSFAELWMPSDRFNVTAFCCG